MVRNRFQQIKSLCDVHRDFGDLDGVPEQIEAAVNDIEKALCKVFAVMQKTKEQLREQQVQSLIAQCGHIQLQIVRDVARLEHEFANAMQGKRI